MQKKCAQCGQQFQIADDEIKFLDKISPVFNGVKYPLPAPENCPDCRLKERTINRNEQYFYQGKSSLSGKPLISLYSPDTEWGKKFKVFSPEEWWSDAWDAETFGMDFDFNRPFFEQFEELNAKIPKQNLIQTNNENSPYTTGTGFCKNCYLINCSENDEDCFYGKLIQSSRDIMDSCFIYDSELLYECFNCTKCYNCAYLSFSQTCTDCMFSENLRGCKNCFLCTNLVNKEYHFMDKPYKKEEYAAKVAEYVKSAAGLEKAKKQLKELAEKRVRKYADIINSENSSGDMITNCKDCNDCYEINDSRDCKYVVVGVNVKDLLDCSNVYLKPELNYQVMGTMDAYNVLFALYIFYGSNVIYSQNCWNCSDLFGCAGLRGNKKHYILNKKYTKEEYEKLVPKIIEHMKKTGEWGKFFAATYAPFGYNETVAHEYLPLKMEDAVAGGYKWKDKDMREYKPQTYVVPVEITDVKDDILDAVLACKNCGKNFKVIPQELKRLRTLGFPVPKNCFDCRQSARMAKRPPRKLFDRKCGKCGAAIKSPYSSDRPEIIYCEKCYLGELT